MRAMAPAEPAGGVQAAKRLMQINGNADGSNGGAALRGGLVGFATDNGGHRGAIRGLSYRKARRHRAPPLYSAPFVVLASLHAAAWGLQNPLVRCIPVAIRRQTGAAMQLSVD